MSSTATRPTREQNDYVARAQRYIVSNLKADLSSAAIAAASGVSSRSLFWAYRALRGTSPVAWVRSLRLQYVRAELLRPVMLGRTISQIASD